jgi:Protein of unknown function (DUF2865)
LVVLLPDDVDARGPPSGSYPTDIPSTTEPVPTSSSHPHPKEASRRSSVRPVCVRLCDGAFFPVASVSRGSENEATCGGLCPDAPTALYFEPTGSDKIEDAVSANGVSYLALPVALRYRTTFDATCTCHRSQARQFPIMRDSTLRKGDYIMTPNGFVVFQGSSHLPHTRNDFTALVVARLPQDQRAALSAMERASAPTPRGSTDVCCSGWALGAERVPPSH